ncbi:epididymal secretory protein E3-beta [Tamandua tetradactyla]|uniref:epididymal secretory protein E3-beta n=1 Tax=Tamandua tetradactyla TaxID=48850 RepID=UPI0040549D31
MSSSLKILGPLLVLLFPLCDLLIHGQNLSWKDFMKQHYLRPTQEFGLYKCNVLMREIEGLKGKNSHTFIYTLWHHIDRICSKSWKERYSNVYIWARSPIKVLKCFRENFKKSYKERRSYSYIQFHCGMNGYVDSIEDVQLLEVINM